MMGCTASIPSNVLSFSDARRQRAQTRRMNFDEVYADLLDAIFDQRLSAGQPLAATWIGQAYRASRGTAAKVLERLSLAGLIEKRPSQAASVTALDRAQVAQMLEARRHAEVCIVTALAGHLTHKDISALRTLALRERQYAERQQASITIRLACEFHEKLAQLTGNKPLIRFHAKLVALNSLAIAHQPEQTHSMQMWRTRLALIDALASGGTETAEQQVDCLMQQIASQLISVSADARNPHKKPASG